MIWQILTGWFKGWVDKESRGQDWKMGWFVIVGSIPIGVLGLLGQDLIRDALRNLWITASMLILFSFVFIIAERVGKKERGFDELTMKDAIVMGLCQCLALIPGVSRSGGTISGGLFLGLDREVATRFSFPSLPFPQCSHRVCSLCQTPLTQLLGRRHLACSPGWYLYCIRDRLRIYCMVAEVCFQPLLRMVCCIPHPSWDHCDDFAGRRDTAALLNL